MTSVFKVYMLNHDNLNRAENGMLPLYFCTCGPQSAVIMGVFVNGPIDLIIGER